MRISLRRQLRMMIPVAVFAVFITVSSSEAGAGEPCRPHETQVVQQIQRYCSASWQNANIPRSEWPECSQQVFAELLERISRSQLGSAIACSASEERRELNRSIWRIVKRWRRRVRHPSLDGFDVADPASLRIAPAGDDVLEQVARIVADKLTPRQSQIFSLLCEGRSIRQISERLGIPARQTSDEKYRAIQKIRRHVTLS